MFVTNPSYEFFPVGEFATSDARHWRLVNLSLPAPWFVLTVEVADDGLSRLRTLCIAWDTDLLRVLESLNGAKAIALLCMWPGDCPRAGRWSSRQVCEVAVVATAEGQEIVFCDEHGAEFGDRPRTKPQSFTGSRRLILRLDPQSGCGGDSDGHQA